MANHPQLLMIWPSNQPVELSEWRLPAGCSIRNYRPGDEESFLGLMEAGNFDPWDEAKLHYNAARAIPGGWFLAVDERVDRVVGTVVSLHNYSGSTYFTGDLGWLAVDPSYRGRGLGYSLAAHATDRLLKGGYSRIQLHTEGFRLPAVKIYLRLGYVPVLCSRELCDVWEEVCEQLRWEFTPRLWPTTRPACWGNP